MKIFCDIDSTINNHWVRIQRNTTIDGHLKLISNKAYSRSEVMKDEPLKMSRESIKRLSQDHEIHFLTARDFDNAFSITKEWLDKNSFIYDSINIVKNTMEKVDFLIKNNSDLFIDDLSRLQHYGPSYLNLYEDVIKELKIKNINFILFKGDWTETIKEIYGN